MENNQRMQWLFLQLIWLAALSIVSWPGHALAHGGGMPQLTNILVGPYRLFVWSQPEPLRAGEMHITVAVVEAVGTATANDSAAVLDTPVLNATVQLELRPVDNPAQVLVSAATRDQAIFPQYYEANLEVPTVGSWQARVIVTGPAGKGNASFDFAVLPPRKINWLLVAGGILLLLLLSAAGRLRSKATRTG